MESTDFKKGNGVGPNVLGHSSAGGNPFVQTPLCKVLYVRRALQYHLTVPANTVWSIPKMPLIDRAGKLTCLPLRAPPSSLWPVIMKYGPHYGLSSQMVLAYFSLLMK